MTTLQILMSIPAAALGIALIRDFFAGLSEERLWGDPAQEA